MPTADRRSVVQLAFWAFAIVVLLGPFVHGRYTESPSINAFRAFYCAGRTIQSGRDPYRVEPLRTCEVTIFAKHQAAGVVEPAPLAPFILAGFTLLATLPYAVALGLFVAMLILATAVAIWSLRRITGYTTIFLTACLLWTALYRNIAFAEIPPLVIGVFCASAFLLERGRAHAAAAVAVAALVEPHVAIPTLVALAIWYPRTRLLFAAFAVVLASISVAVVGIATSVEYVTKALPLHAASEVGANDQYSLTWLLHQMGAGDDVALRLGSVSYLILSIAGIVLARRMAVSYERPSLLVLVPATFAMIGGSFIHDIQLPIALPAALVFLRVGPARFRPFLLASIGILAVAWFYDGRVPFILQVVIVGSIIAAAPRDALRITPRYPVVLAAGAAYAVLITAIHALPAGLPMSFAAFPDVSGSPDAIASDVWARFVRATPYGYTSVQTLAAKIPTEAALLLVAALMAVAGRKPVRMSTRTTASTADRAERGA